MVITGLTAERLAARRTALEEFASPGTEVRFVVTPEGPASVESEAELELAAPGILAAVVEASQAGADAIVIWGGHDPSLRAARELVDVPVIGPGMASMLLICSLVRRFSLLVQLPNVCAIAERQVQELGLGSRCASILSVGVPVLDLGDASALPAMQQAALHALDEDGADGVCFGCMAMTPHAEPLRRWLAELRPGAVVVNPGRAAIRWAEMLVDMGHSHSRRSYPRPPKRVAL